MLPLLLQPWRNLGVSLKDYMDSSVRSGKAYSGGGDSSTKSGRQFFTDSSSRAGNVYNEKSTRAGTVWDSTHTQAGTSAPAQAASGVNGYNSGQRTVLAPIPSFNHRGQTSSDFAERNVKGSIDLGTPGKKVHRIAPL